MISDAWARRTAAEWHAGQASALPMLASSGATHDGRHGWDALLAETASAGPCGPHQGCEPTGVRILRARTATPAASAAQATAASRGQVTGVAL